MPPERAGSVTVPPLEPTGPRPLGSPIPAGERAWRAMLAFAPPNRPARRMSPKRQRTRRRPSSSITGLARGDLPSAGPPTTHGATAQHASAAIHRPPLPPGSPGLRERARSAGSSRQRQQVLPVYRRPGRSRPRFSRLHDEHTCNRAGPPGRDGRGLGVGPSASPPTLAMSGPDAILSLHGSRIDCHSRPCHPLRKVHKLRFAVLLFPGEPVEPEPSRGVLPRRSP